MNSLTELPVTILIVPARSAKNSRPSGAHASAVANLASSTSVLCPDGPLTVTVGVSHEVRRGGGRGLRSAGRGRGLRRAGRGRRRRGPAGIVRAAPAAGAEHDAIRRTRPVNGRAGFGTSIPSGSGLWSPRTRYVQTMPDRPRKPRHVRHLWMFVLLGLGTVLALALFLFADARHADAADLGSLTERGIAHRLPPGPRHSPAPMSRCPPGPRPHRRRRTSLHRLNRLRTRLPPPRPPLSIRCRRGCRDG